MRRGFAPPDELLEDDERPSGSAGPDY